MAMNGADITLIANTGTPSVPIWTSVGSQRGVTFPESVAPIDYSSKESRSRAVGAGRYQASVSLTSLYVPTGTAHAALKTAFRAGSPIKIRRSGAAVQKEQCDAIITEMNVDAPDQAEATIAITLEVDGDWAAV